MRKAGDTILRSLAMLRTIPVQPRFKTTREIRDEVLAADPDFDVDIRSIQRGLEKLATLFPIASVRHGRANRWSWTQDEQMTQLPAMGVESAFALKVAGEHLKSTLPASVLRLLAGYLRTADEVLRAQGRAGSWARKARIIRSGPATPPPVRGDVLDGVCRALLEDRQFEVTVADDDGLTRRVLHPLGIVVQDGVLHLVAADAGAAADFALHRMTSPKPLDDAVRRPRGFSLARHVEASDAFRAAADPAEVRLRAAFEPGAAARLEGLALAADQRIGRRRDGRTLLEATVADTEELRAWLLAFGAAVEVLAPKRLRDAVAAEARAMARAYS